MRLDSGDLAQLARDVRRMLDDGGLKATTIFASGNLDEYQLRDLVAAGAPIDGFGIGTSLVTSSDAPSLDAVYKLQEYAGRPRRKRSTGKATWPGRKQIYRHSGPDGRFAGDTVTVETDPQPGEPLLEQVLAGGRRVERCRRSPRAGTGRERSSRDCRGPLGGLDAVPAPYPVEIARSLHALAAEVDAATAEGE